MSEILKATHLSVFSALKVPKISAWRMIGKNFIIDSLFVPKAFSAAGD